MSTRKCRSLKIMIEQWKIEEMGLSSREKIGDVEEMDEFPVDDENIDVF